MHAGNDDNDIAVDAIVDPIREPADKRASGISVNYRVDALMSSNAGARGLHSRQELIAQAWPLALVPKERLLNIRSCCWTDNDWH